MKPLFLFLGLLLAFQCPPRALADGVQGPFRPQDIFGLSRATDLRVRPDGSSVAYVRITNDMSSDRGRPSIWLVDTATGAESPVAADANANLGPRWSPDGSRLTYLVSRPDGGATEIAIRWMASGRTDRIAIAASSPADLAWSPDGHTLAFTALVQDRPSSLAASLAKPDGAKWAEPLKAIERPHYRSDGAGYLQAGYRHLFVVSAAGGPARQVTSGPFDDVGPISFARDSESILFASNRGEDPQRNPNRSDIYRVSTRTGVLAPLTAGNGSWTSPVESPDGALIAYVGHVETPRAYENDGLYVMRRAGGEARLLSGGLDRSVSDPQWAADSRGVYVRFVDRGTGKVARLSLNGRIDPLSPALANALSWDRPYAGGSYSIGGQVVAFTEGDAQHPSNVAVFKHGQVRRLTALSRDLLEQRELAKVEVLPVASSVDGLQIGAWIATPPGFDPRRKYPLILEVHGGPQEAYGASFSSDVQLYAAAGYVVVYGNPRGSSSYGAGFANALGFDYPGADYDDLMSIVDAAIARGFVDPRRLFVTGGSGGGALTAWIVGKTHRFAAAAAQKPVIDWTSETLTTDETARMVKGFFGKPPWEDPAGYWRHSPLSLVANITAPTLLVVGEQDFRTPPGQAEELYQALQLRGVPTALVRVPGASHGGLAARPSQSAAKALTILRWFARYGGPQVD